MLSSIFQNVDNFKRTEFEKKEEFTRKISKKRAEADEDELSDEQGNTRFRRTKSRSNDDDDNLINAELRVLGRSKKDKERKPRKPKKESLSSPGTEIDNGSELEIHNVNKTPEEINKDLRTIFVGNVSLDVSVKEIRSLFNQYGEVESIRQRSMPLTGTAVDDEGNQNLVKKVSANKGKLGDQKSSQNCYIVYKQQEQAQKVCKIIYTSIFIFIYCPNFMFYFNCIYQALIMNGHHFHGRHLRVDTIKLSRFDPSKTVYLGGLSKFIDEEKLREFFSKVLPNGQQDIEGVRLIRDPETQYGKGFGYLMLRDSDGVMAALKCHGKKIKNREMRVTTCGKRTKRSVKDRARSQTIIPMNQPPIAEGVPVPTPGTVSDSKPTSNEEKNKEEDNQKKEKKQDRKKQSEFEVAAMRRVKAKMAKSIAGAKRRKTAGLNKNEKKGKKLGGVLKKALKAAAGKAVLAKGKRPGVTPGSLSISNRDRVKVHKSKK
jgi:nucleolar protein 12